MNSQQGLHEYWKHPTAENLPKKYLSSKRKDRSLFLISILEALKVKKDASILEIGCNSGRNLMYLWKAGYRNLAGIEINPDAVDLMRQKLPYLDANVMVGPAEELLWGIKRPDVIFTVAVLVHIHPDGDFIFELMKDKTKKYIVTLEDEVSNKDRHIRRNYQDVFERLGMRQVYYSSAVPGMHVSYCARAFKKVRGQ